MHLARKYKYSKPRLCIIATASFSIFEACSIFIIYFFNTYNLMSN